MIKILFYLPAVLAIIYEMDVLRNTKLYKEVFDTIRTIGKKPKDERNFSQKQSLLLGLMLLYHAWAVVGIFSPSL